MRKTKGPVVAAITVGLLTASLAGVAAQADGEPPTDGPVVSVVSPGPLGEPYAEWARRAWQWKLANDPIVPGFIGSDIWPNLEYQRGDDPIDCELGQQGEVFFLPGGDADCTIVADQYILAVPAAQQCAIDTKLVKRARNAKGKRRGKLERQIEQRAAFVYNCLSNARTGLSEPFLVVDDEVIPVDEGFFTTSTPFDFEDQRFMNPGYYVMIEPLAPGIHRIEFGWNLDDPDFPIDASIVIEVVEPADE